MTIITLPPGAALADFANVIGPRPVAALAEEERAQVQQRVDQEATRRAQMEQLESALDDRQAQAEELSGSLLRAGLAEAAERHRRASRRQSFNAARRGLAGGSAAIQQQAETRERANQEAEQAAVQSQTQLLSRALQALQQRDKLAQALLQANPIGAQVDAQRIGGIQQQAADQERVAAAQLGIDQANAARRQGIASAIGGGIGSLGAVLGASMAGGG